MYPPGPGIPPRTRYTPLGTRYAPPGPGTPPVSSACWEIRATSGRYASYWNAFLFSHADYDLADAQVSQLMKLFPRCEITNETNLARKKVE